MKYIKIYLVVLICILLFKNSNGQILNIDRIVNDSMSKAWYGLVSGSISFDKQKQNIADISGYSECVVKRKNNYGFVYMGQYDGTLSQNDFIQNEGFFQIRYRDLDTRVKSVEGYIQYQWNGIWGMESRRLMGLNFRRRLFVNKNADGFLGVGGFYQMERWNYSGVESNLNQLNPNRQAVNDNNFRSNLYLKVAKKLFHGCDIVVQNMLQTSTLDLYTKPDLRWLMIAEVTYDINNRFQLTYTYDHMYNQQPVVPIKKLYFGSNLSISLRL